MSLPDQHDARERMQRELVRCNAWASCLNCEHWRVRTIAAIRQEQSETSSVIVGCEMANRRTPPADVLVYGCACWSPDIPF